MPRTSPILRSAVAFATLFAFFSPAGASDGERVEMLRKSFDVKPAGTVVMRLPVGEIVVSAREENEDTAEVIIYLAAGNLELAREIYADMQIDVTGSDGTVTIAARDATMEWNWKEWGWYNIDIEVRVPAAFNVKVDAGEGDIRISSLAGDLDLATIEGDVILGDILSETARIFSGEGDIEIDSLTSGSVHIETEHGSLEIEELFADAQVELVSKTGGVSIRALSGPVTVSTEDGDIFLGLTAFGGVNAGTTSGDILIRAPDDLKAEIDLTGETVNVEMAAEAFEGQKTGTRARGVLHGGGLPLRARSDEGRVVLQGPRTRRGASSTVPATAVKPQGS